jgi:hypothetical protein
MSIKPLLLSALAALLHGITPVFAQQHDDQPDEPAYRTESFTGPFTAVVAQSSGGGLTLIGDQPANTVRVEMFVRGSGWPNKLTKAEIESRLAEYEIVMKPDGNTVRVSAKRKTNRNDWKTGLNIGFVMHSPRQMAGDLNTSGGGIRLSDLAGQQRFNTSGGGVNLTKLTGDVSGRTSGGGIHIADCQANMDVTTSGGGIDAANANGKLRLNTSGGGIKLNKLGGEILAHTSGGGIVADDIDGTLDASTSGGSIRLHNLAGSVSASTSAGSIDADITRADKFVRLSTTAGSVHLRMPLDKGMDLDLRGNRVTMPLTKFDGVSDKDHIQGRMNGGGIAVSLSASSGNVSVNQ